MQAAIMAMFLKRVVNIGKFIKVIVTRRRAATSPEYSLNLPDKIHSPRKTSKKLKSTKNIGKGIMLVIREGTYLAPV